MFGKTRRSHARASFVRPSGLIAPPTGPVRSAVFDFDPNNQPAVSLDKVPAVDLSKSRVDLRKTHQAATEALTHVDLAGIRFEVIVMVDGSGSMQTLYRQKKVQEMLVRTLGFALNVDGDGSIPVFTYGHGVGQAVDINLGNFEDAHNLVIPDYGLTNMAAGFEAAMAKARTSGKLTMVVNITDGGPMTREDGQAGAELKMKNLVITSSAEPIMVKNLAVLNVPFLEDLDDMPSTVAIREDANGNPIRDANGNLELYRNNAGVRWIDNVDSKGIDPLTATDEEFAAAFADEVNACIEVMARAGTLTGLPGYSREF